MDDHVAGPSYGAASGGYQPDEPLTGGPPEGARSGVRARPTPAPPVTLEPRVVRALELIALAMWADAPKARGIARRILDEWEGSCDDDDE